MEKLSSSDRRAMIHLASSLPKGSEDRRSILAVVLRLSSDLDRLINHMQGVPRDVRKRVLTLKRRSEKLRGMSLAMATYEGKGTPAHDFSYNFPKENRALYAKRDQALKIKTRIQERYRTLAKDIGDKTNRLTGWVDGYAGGLFYEDADPVYEFIREKTPEELDQLAQARALWETATVRWKAFQRDIDEAKLAAWPARRDQAAEEMEQEALDLLQAHLSPA